MARPGYQKAGQRPVKSRKEVDDFLARINLEVAQLPDDQVAKLRPIIAEAMEELADDLQQWLGDGSTDATERFTAQNIRQKLLQLKTAFAKIDQLSGKVEKTLKAGALDAEALAREHLIDTVSFYLPNYDASLIELPLARAGNILTQKSVIESFASSTKRYGADTVKQIKASLALGVVKGESPLQMAKRIAPKIDTRNPGKAIGEQFSKQALFRAERIVRTELNAAYNASAVQQQKSLASDNPDVEILSQWVAIIDGRTCAVCRGLDGRSWPSDETPAFGLPPKHPHCRCATVAIIKPPQ